MSPDQLHGYVVTSYKQKHKFKMLQRLEARKLKLYDAHKVVGNDHLHGFVCTIKLHQLGTDDLVFSLRLLAV